MEIVHSHTFEQTEARARIAALADYLRQRHGVAERWNGDDEVVLSGKYSAFSIEATVKVEDGRVCVTGKDPGFALRAAAKAYVGRKLSKYLDPAVVVSELPRS